MSKDGLPLPTKVQLSGISYESREGLSEQQLLCLDTTLQSLLSSSEMCVIEMDVLRMKVIFLCYSTYLSS